MIVAFTTFDKLWIPIIPDFPYSLHKTMLLT
jgi:hypothetical protein